MSIHLGMVLKILRDEGPQSRAELARRCGLSATTLTHLTAQLLKDGCIAETDAPVLPSGSPAPGRPPVSVRLVPSAHYVAGVHIGAEAVQVAICDLTAQLVTSAAFDHAANDNPLKLTHQTADVLRNLARGKGISLGSLVGIGMGVPGPVDQARRRNLLSINTGWRDVAFADAMEAELNIPTVVEHNVTAMALAEAHYGIGQGCPAVLYVYLGTGLGAGLVVDGMPFRPGGHGAVELGHIQIDPQGALCACGNRGCLETFVSERVLRERGAGSAEPLLAALARNPALHDEVAGHFTTALANAVNLLTPDLIVLGGHFAEAPEAFYARLRCDLPPRVLPHMRDVLRIERGGFGNNAGAVGAAAVALDHLFYSGVSR
ncbi:ROK family transcriptional regulator [Brucella sp. 6810]|uniref:ROK family transcriptional regulator n=1 Tax=unclassified Brucella TaxID=2632610 RepID=UPI0012948F72|nr:MULTISPECIES: ROK family transcriptional regulator [unclassified Brucella]QGA58802.1 ROK family protein [Brucella sp. 2280]QNQ63853.1 ROK family transcriptional regulator [Brucella sp. 6810]